DASQSPPEPNAAVTVTSSSGSQFELIEDKDYPGIYRRSGLTLDPSATYKLNIVTSSGRSYSSKDIELRQAPSLDSIVWRGTETGIRFFVNAHDASNNT